MFLLSSSLLFMLLSICRQALDDPAVVSCAQAQGEKYAGDCSYSRRICGLSALGEGGVDNRYLAMHIFDSGFNTA